jgi:deoxyribonuclease V
VFLALDVHYADDHVRGAAVAFARIEDATPSFVIVDDVPGAPAEYESGRFALRELPYLVRLVNQARDRLDAALSGVIVDGHVWLEVDRPGLGHYLYEALRRTVPVIGIAKTRFRGAPAGEVRRGASENPLFVTSIGMERAEAERVLATMHGPHRVPTLLKVVDRASRGDAMA